MKILLVNVHYEDVSRYLTHYLPSLTLRQLVAITPEKYEIVDILDTIRPDKIDFNGDYDVVGISAVTPSALYAYELADKFRKNGKIVVLGGYHPTSLPEEAKQHADSVVMGEAEETWPQLLKDLEAGKIKKFYKNKSPVDPLLIPNPERGRFPRGTSFAGLSATRGCPVGCKFCCISNTQFGNIFRKKPVDMVVEDIKSIKDKFVFFTDPSLTTDVNYTKSLFKEVKHLNKKFVYCQGNVNVLAKDDELLKLARDAGVIEWHVGFESITQKTLEQMHKPTNNVEEYLKVIKKIRDYGMSIFGEFVFGFDSDTIDVFDKTADILKDWDISPGFQVLTPYPGSQYFKELDEQGRILTYDWSKYTVRDVVFQPKNMTPEELEEGVKRIHKEFYSLSQVFKRVFRSISLGYYPFKRVYQVNSGIASALKE